MGRVDRFSLVSDADADGSVGPSDQIAASCVTGGDGGCRFDGLPLGGWVLHQDAAPRGFDTAADIPFALIQPGQVARIRVVNGAGVSGSDVKIIQITRVLPASETQSQPTWWARVPKTFADIFLRNWVQALLFALTGLLFGAPAYLAVRRRELTHAREAI